MGDEAEPGQKFPGQIFGIDRTGWATGPWDDEDDRYDWWARAGLPAMIHRSEYGHLNGYVAVPPGHRCHGLGCDDLPISELFVHCGVTYASLGEGHLCRMLAPGEADQDWWFGFDCGHAFDYKPGLRVKLALVRGLLSDSIATRGRSVFDRLDSLERYRDVAYVKDQCETLALQLARATPAVAPFKAATRGKLP